MDHDKAMQDTNAAHRRAVEAGFIVPMTYNGTVKDAEASRPSDANVELHYWPYKNGGSWHHDDSRVQLLAERLKLRGFHVGLVAHDEEKWDHEGLVKLTNDLHSLVLGQFQHNHYYRKLPSESMEAADEFAKEWLEKRQAAAA